LLFQIIPVALGWRSTIDAGLARVFFSWTLHAIVYFWLMPTYIAYYTIVPLAVGGRLFSDTMGRIAFVLFPIVAMPIASITSSRIRRSAPASNICIRCSPRSSRCRLC
jgi:cytochrome c oxidase subunit 1